MLGVAVGHPLGARVRATVATVGTGVGTLVGAQRDDSELGVAVVEPPLGA